MARLFGLIGNRAELAGRILAQEADALRVRSPGPGAQVAWGVGFCQSGDVLLRRRPIDEHDEVAVVRVAGDVKADVVVGHVRTATVGGLRTENTHPFRYRQLLFAQTGTVLHFQGAQERLRASIPEYLRGGISGDTDAEIVFHIMLSFLHDAGRLNEPTTDPQHVAAALRSTMTLINHTTAERGAGESELNILVGTPDFILALHGGKREMAIRTFAGREDADAILGDDTALRRRVPELGRLHCTLVASDFDEPPPARWKRVPPSAIVTMLRGEPARIDVG